MPNLKVKNLNNQEALIFFSGIDFTVSSSDIKFEYEIRRLVTEYSKQGLVIFSEPEKRKPNEIKIIRQRIFTDHPLFLVSLGKELASLGYKVTYRPDKEKIIKKELENEVRRLLESLSITREDQKMIEKIWLAIPKMSLEQLKIVKKDLQST